MPRIAGNDQLRDRSGRELFSLHDINRLEPAEKEAIYRRLLPPRLAALLEKAGGGVVDIVAPRGLRLVRMEARLAAGDRDPLFFLELCDTHHRQMELAFCQICDPAARRFEVDRDSEGRNNVFATHGRNLAEELRAMEAGLFPHQVRHGLRMFGEFLPLLERLTDSLGMELIVAEPLSYDNAIRYEKYGFDYVVGKKLMLEIDAGFAPGGELFRKLDGSTPFRRPGMERTVRGRSWAIHDGILGEPWDEVRIYKTIGVHAGVNTFPGREG
ncbi:hypothetical protein GMSM_31390 [Geomonas sp. Red276]